MQHHESKLQSNCVKWFRLQHRDKLIFAIPNGGKRNIREAQFLKAEGVLPGVADLFIAYPSQSYHGLFVEMKFGKGKQTDAQHNFQLNIEKAGYKYEICNSFDNFVNKITEYLR